jgi:hypothetical protein
MDGAGVWGTEEESENPVRRLRRTPWGLPASPSVWGTEMSPGLTQTALLVGSMIQTASMEGPTSSLNLASCWVAKSLRSARVAARVETPSLVPVEPTSSSAVCDETDVIS